MSVTINTNGGGGGSIQPTDALVRVVADYGSSVSVTAGGATKTLKSLPIVGETGKSCYYDVIKPGNFSASARSYTASLGGDTASGSLVVNSSGEYTELLSYWNGQLFDDGNEFVAHTGGWEATNTRWRSYWDYPIGNITPQFSIVNGEMDILVATSYPDNKSGSVVTRNKIDLSGFNRITINARHIDGNRQYILYVTEDKSLDPINTSCAASAVFLSETTGYVDVSNLDKNKTYYVGVSVVAFSANNEIGVSSIIMS